MSKFFALSLAVISLVASAGCGPPEATEDERPTDSEAQQALRDSAFESMVEPMDRARAVEQLQLDRKDRLDAALDDSGDR